MAELSRRESDELLRKTDEHADWIKLANLSLQGHNEWRKDAERRLKDVEDWLISTKAVGKVLAKTITIIGILTSVVAGWLKLSGK